MRYFALADCNNFYVSCERVFNPALERKPVVILSNNDGCIISRSNEAKALGIPMGAPAFKYRYLIQKHNIHCLSSNYSLYGDMSQRVMSCFKSLCPDMEVYSIDEAFLKLDEYSHSDLFGYLSEVRQKIKQWTGIPISIGLAPTKTLAKLANAYAKSFTELGVYDLRDAQVRDTLLKTFPIDKIWGIGHKLSQKLYPYAIKTAFDLQQANAKILRKRFSVVVERIILELNGISCLDLENVQPKKQIMSSRSFGHPVTSLQDLSEAISTYTSRAAYKLRGQQCKAQAIYVFITTNKHKLSDEQYKKGLVQRLIEPTNDTSVLIKAAQQVLKQLYLPGFKYKKGGILLMELTPDNPHYTDFFTTAKTTQKSELLMKTLDGINDRFNSGTLFFAAQGIEQAWAMRSENRSPRYTTHWQEVAIVYA